MPQTVLAILAGGSSRRYQGKDKEWQDKILSPFNNEPFLVNIVRRSILLYEKTVLSVNSNTRKEEYSSVLQKYNLQDQVDFIKDDQYSAFEGVMLGIGSTLRFLRDQAVQLLPSDRPFLMLSLLKLMKTCDDGVSFFQSESGMIEPLLALYSPQTYFPKQFEELSLSRADVLMRSASEMKIYDSTTALKMNNLPTKTFDNVNVQTEVGEEPIYIHEHEELELPKPRMIRRKIKHLRPELSEKQSLYAFIEELNELDNNYSAFLWSMYYRKASLLTEHEYQELAIKSLNSEYLFWNSIQMPFFALHALQDLIHFFPKEKNGTILKNIINLKKEMKIQPRTISEMKK